MFVNIFSMRPKISSSEINELGRNIKLGFLIHPSPEHYDEVKKQIQEMMQEYNKRKLHPHRQRAMYAAMRVPMSTVFKISDRTIWDWEAMHWFGYREENGKFIVWWQGWLVGGVLAEKNPSRGKAIDVDLKKLCHDDQGKIYFYDLIHDKVLGKYDKAKNHPFYNMSKEVTENYIKTMKSKKKK